LFAESNWVSELRSSEAETKSVMSSWEAKEANWRRLLSASKDWVRSVCSAEGFFMGAFLFLKSYRVFGGSF
ncbi:hypothetical protein EBT16_14930, partial [bacterium]|nr:hypothetical protein [bacterium]